MPVAQLPQTEFRLSARAALGAIDSAKGFFKDVSLMTEGEALGHGCFCDTKTLQGVFGLAQKSPVKAYLTHGSMFEADRLGQEVGLFSGIYIEAKQVKAKQFTFFKSFKEGTDTAAKYAALMDLAEADPSLFGVSLSFSGSLVWSMPDGAEMEFSEDRPEGCEMEMPSVRVGRIYSADFVGDPAANPSGLFDARRIAAAQLLGIELPTLRSADVSPSPLTKPAAVTVIDAAVVSKPNNISMIKDLRSKFSDPAVFTRACEIYSLNDKLTIAEIETAIAGEAKESASIKLAADFEALTLAQVEATKKHESEVAALKADLAAARLGATAINLGNGGDGGGDILARYSAMGNNEAGAFYAANREAIARAVSARNDAARAK